MKRQIPGLNTNQPGVENKLEGLFLVRVDRAHYRWHPQKPFVELRFVVLEPKPFENRLFSGRLYCTERALWKLNRFLRDFGYDTQLLKDDQVDERALSNLRGVVRTSLYNSERTRLPEPRRVRPRNRLGSTRMHITDPQRWAGRQ